MNKILPFAIVGVVIILALLFIPTKRGKHFDSRFTLNPKDKIPYGTNVSYSLLSKLFPSAKVTVNRNEPGAWKNLNVDTGNQVLMIVAFDFDPTEEEMDNILSFAQKGNYVFISALSYNQMAMDVFKITQNHSSGYDFKNKINDIIAPDSFKVLLDTGAFHTPVAYTCPGASYDNWFMDYDPDITYPLGYTEHGRPNLLAMNTIKGTVFLHSAPLTLTNFFLLYKNNYKYLEQLTAMVPVKPTHVVWDEYYLFSAERSKKDNDSKGILSVILNYPNFQWAFWLTLAVLVVYLFTESSRKQRQIPDYSKPKNEHMEFISTVGKLYFEKGDHLNLASKMSQFFLEHVRTKYKLNTSHINDDFAKALSIKTGIEQEEANVIIGYIQQTQIGSITVDDLKHFYNHLENFYKKA
jgi:hypothetical protein